MTFVLRHPRAVQLWLPADRGACRELQLCWHGKNSVWRLVIAPNVTVFGGRIQNLQIKVFSGFSSCKKNYNIIIRLYNINNVHLINSP